MTLKELYDQHPEWRDLPMVIYNPSEQQYNYVGAAGLVYKAEDEDAKGEITFVLAFVPN